MPLASLFKRSKAAPAASASPAGPEDDGPVQQARVRARRRLIGAVVLMALGVVLFPLLFETQPRPLPRDIPIEVARKGAEPAPAASPVQAESSLSEREALEPAPASATPVAAAVPTAAPARASEAPAIAPAPAAASKAQATSVASAESRAAPSHPAPAKPEPKPEAKPEPKPGPKPESKPAAETAAAKASAPTSQQASSPTAAAASAPGSGRFVVQVGAFTDPAALREARQRVEKLGMKSYTQEIVTPAGKRTRVRVGPFATREEADRAGARLKAVGLPAYMLQL